jgi:hypothetical protein
MKIYVTFCGAVVAVAVLVMGFVPAAFAGSLPSLLGPLESWSSCSQSLCIDAPPEGPKGLDGSGGWGWNSSANAPVTALKVGKPAALTVTVLQPSNVPACAAQEGSITLTYSSQDFSLNSTSSGGTSGTNPFDRGGVLTFSYTGDFWCHMDQSDAFTFTPQNPTNNAFVTATVTVGGQQVSETFPVAILPKF